MRVIPAVVIGLLVGAAGWLLVLQKTEREKLRAELEQMRARQAKAGNLTAENQRLGAAAVSESEMARLRADHAALDRLRAEIEALRKQTEERKLAMAKAIAAGSLNYEPTMLDGPLPVKFWKEAGAATPGAALETVLWAAAGGNVEALANRLQLDPTARGKAETLLASLPESERVKYSSPEALIATLTTKDVPLGTARLFDTKADYGGNRLIIADMRDAEGKSRRARFAMHEDGGEWRIVVPASVVENYAAALKGGSK